MAITLTGYKRQCGRQTGGVSRIGVAQASDIKGVTTSEGAITGIEFKGDVRFVDIESAVDQAEYTYANGETSLLIRLNRVGKESSRLNNELADLAPCGLVALAQLNNGETVLIGYSEEFKLTRPIIAFDSNATSGKALTDENFFDITLKTTQVLAPLFLSDSVEIDTLFAAAAAE